MQSKYISFKSVMDSFIKNLPAFKSGILKPEEMSHIRTQVNEMFAIFGIITFKSLYDGRKKPYKNSPFGIFVNRGADGKHIDSFILSEEGENEMKHLLKTYIPDGLLYNGKIKDRKKMETEIQNEISKEVLENWLASHHIKQRKAENGKGFYFSYNKKQYTYYYGSNTVVTKGSCNKVFWFLLDAISPIPDNKSIRAAAEQIYTCHYELKFSGESFVWRSEIQSKNDEISALKKEMAEMKKNMEMLMNGNLEKEKKISLMQTTSEIKDSIRNLAHSLPKRPYLSSICNWDMAPTEFERNKLKEAYEYLEGRNLIDAVNAPEWKYNFNGESIELLCRIDKHASAVYDVRHRYVEPMILSDGTKLKEKADREEGEKKFKLPYGLERINYRNKNIFIVEGIFDGCFIKNSLAITTAVMPHDMRKVIDIFRKNGFQIIHVPDNFRAGDKGGKAALREYAKPDSDIFMPGDLVFNWEIWQDLKDINEVAMHHGWNEVDPKKVLTHCWNVNEVNAEALKFIK